MTVKLILKKLHCYLLLFNMAFFYFLLYPPLYYCSRKPERYAGMVMLRRWWAFLSALFAGIIFRFEFEAPLERDKAYVICPWHTSNLDTLMVSLLMKTNHFSFMGKEELKNGLITGIYFRTVDIPVNRDSKIAGFRAFRKASERLQSGAAMVMFPEGGIANEYPPAIQEFKNGPFRLAIEQNAPVVPVTSLNTWHIMWDDGLKYGTRPGICRIVVHRPIETTGCTTDDADMLRDRVYQLMSAKLHNAG